MRITKSITVNTTKENLWTWITEFEKLKQWNKTLLQEDTLSKGPPGPGFKSKVLILEGKKKVWYQNEILTYKPYDLLKVQLAGGNLGKGPMVVTYQLQKTDNGSNLLYESHWKPVGLMLKLLHPIITIMASKNAENCLYTLKNMLETPGNGGALGGSA